MDKTMESLIIEILSKASQTIATAESCTGGLLAHRLTNVPGASTVFQEGLITYSNASKIKLLHIPKSVLDTHGPVSQEVAKAMAEGVRILSKTTFGLATTGIAGPAGIGSSKGSARDLPVGTLFLAIAAEGRPTLVWREFFALARIFHTDRDEETAKADGVRRVMKSDDGCMSPYCPRKTSSSTQHPSGFSVSAVDEYEISGLARIFHTEAENGV